MGKVLDFIMQMAVFVAMLCFYIVVTGCVGVLFYMVADILRLGS